MPRSHDNPNWHAQRLASSEARNVATRRLREMFPDAWRQLYNEEAQKRGITTAGSKREQKIKKLKAELARLEKLES